MVRNSDGDKFPKSNGKTTTLTDVAKRAGVSQVAASVVLNGARSNVRVSPETRRRLEELALEMNYHPNAVARGLLRGRMNTLGILFNTVQLRAVNNPYSMGIFQGVLDAAAVANYNVSVFTKPANEIENSASFARDGRTDGILVIAPVLHSLAVQALAAQKIPVIAVSARAEDLGVPSVDVDNAYGARLAMEHLLALGHRRIAHLSGPIDQSDAVIRRETYQQALADAGVTPRADYIAATDYVPQRAYTATRELLGLPSPPTAIFAVNDAAAKDAILAARDLGVAVPEQLSIVGFDDAGAADTMPPLTTVHHPLELIGEMATRLLLALLDGEDVPIKTHLIQPKLIVRGSTGPVPQS